MARTPTIDPPDNGGDIIDEPMNEALSKRYLAYALSTITARALPDARDGLKPVHRRVLYSMAQLGLNPQGGHRKSATVVGEVIGKYHPHGDQSIYDAMVRLAQDFATRAPLVDGQGNFGNIDGDAPAAFRYTEAKLTPAAMLLLEGLDDDAVDFKETYDERNREPVVLASGFPNLLVNGSSGIAVGMATSIPPHNPSECIDAAIHLLDHPKASVDDLIKIVTGPDFPTGGVIVETKEGLREVYTTGRGGVRVQARWFKEDLGRGMWRVIVTEIPYQVQKSKLMERLAELIETKKAPLLEDAMDESTEDVRIVLTPKSRTVEADVLMASLFRQCELETRFPVNINVLDHGVPKVMGLRELLSCYLDHRREVILRRATHRLGKIDHRLEVLDGLLKAYLNIDEVIRIIRTEDDPKAVMVKRFRLSEIQVEAILNMRLRALRKLEEIEIRREHKELAEEKREIELLLGSTGRQWTEVKRQLKGAREIFDPGKKLGKRRSNFDVAKEIDTEAALEALIVKEPVTVVLSEKGWIRALKGHNQKLDDLKFKEGDELALSLECQTTDKVILMASGGRAFTIGADKLPGGRGHGEPIRLNLEVPESEHIIAMLIPEEKGRRIVASSKGYGFIVTDAELISSTRKGKIILNVGPKELTAVCVKVEGDLIASIGKNRKLVIFKTDELPEMTRGKGVKIQSFGDGGLLDLKTFAKADGLTWSDTAGRQQSAEDWKDWVGKRAQSGRLAPRGFNKNGKFVG
ncbi:MAG: DNA topoisomerase IV subunit A [Rhodobacterales bacterium 12-64-8]|nr:MAG: DNA topoisomerase IV subunit A [Rhodobacterales bacterium 12-64-8]OYX50765.1 MAG: DNA topoisomerase IV subunit A [Alphaproteobacteria bacterium 32-64-14]